MPSATRELVPACRVKVAGQPLPPRAAADLLAVSVEDDVDAPGVFALRLLTWDQARQKVSWADDRLFAVGADVVVEMGYSDRLKPLIAGEITGLEPEFGARELPVVTVRGHDLRHRLLRGAKTRSFAKASDADIASRIAREHSLRLQASPTPVKHEYVLQRNQTDWAFLAERARRIGYEVAVEGKVLCFRPRRNGAGPSLHLGRADLLEFWPRLTTLGQVSEVTVRGWDPKTVKPVVGQAGTRDLGKLMGGRASGGATAERAFGKAAVPRIDLPAQDRAEAAGEARGLLRELALQYVTGEGLVTGRSELKAGIVVGIQGLGQRFSGPYYVVSTRHTYDPRRGYRTAFTVRRNAS